MKKQARTSQASTGAGVTGRVRTIPVRPRQSRTDSRKREILKAALHCFTTIGFSGATLADIRVRARASIGSIYHHFKSKEQLAAALYVEGLRDYQARFLAELDRHQQAAQAVRGLVRYHLRWVKGNPDWSRFLYDHRQSEFVVAAENAIKDLNEHFFRAVSAQWQRFFDSGELLELPADLFVAILLGPSQDFARHWLTGRAKTRLEDAAEILAESAWRSLSNPNPKIKARPRIRSTLRPKR